MRKSQRNIVLKAAAGAFATVLLITAGALVFRGKMEGLRKNIGELNATIAEFDRKITRVICSGRDLMAGEVLLPEDCTFADVPADMIPADLIGGINELSGKILRVPVRANTYLTAGMFVSDLPKDDEREMKYGFIGIGAEVVNGDCVDIRIRYPDSTDYIVLSKKTVYGADADGLTLHVGEEELLLMDSAIVDAYMYDGVEIYAAVYVEESLQNAAIVNYTPNRSIIDLIEQDPNIVEIATASLSVSARTEIEGRLESIEDY